MNVPMNPPSASSTELYKLQDRILAICSAAETGFFLTGGTAVARGYLNHRYSIDLELHVSDSVWFSLWVEQLTERFRQEPEWSVQILSQDERVWNIFILQKHLGLRVEFRNSGPLHMGKLFDHTLLGKIDNQENILSNKLVSLLAHSEPNDLADIWGLCTLKGARLDLILANSASRAAGVFPPDVSRVLCSASKDDWKLVNWTNPPNFDAYIAQLNQIGENLLLPVVTTPAQTTQAVSSQPAQAAPSAGQQEASQAVRRLRGPGLLNYAAAIKAAAQNSVSSVPQNSVPESASPAVLEGSLKDQTALPIQVPKQPVETARPTYEDGTKGTAELRMRARRKVAYYLPVYLASGALVLGHLADISESGFRIDCKNSIQVGQELKLRLDIPPEIGRKPAILFSAICRWCQPDYIEPVLYNAGFEVSKISPEDVQMYKMVIEKYGMRSRIW